MKVSDMNPLKILGGFVMWLFRIKEFSGLQPEAVVVPTGDHKYSSYNGWVE